MDNTNDGQRTREGGVGRGRKKVPFEDTRPCARPTHETNQNGNSEEKAHRMETPSQQQKTVACSA